jgi:KUP system potassium uptake protein
VALIAGTFFVIDIAFLAANALKLVDGGWIPLVIGGVVFVMLTTWRRGRALLAARTVAAAGPSDDVGIVLSSIASGSCTRVAGTAVYLHRDGEGIPRALLHNMKHNRVVHRRVIFLTVITDAVPTVAAADRVQVAPLAADFWRVTAHYGFMEDPNVPQLLVQAADLGLPYLPAETTYFMGRETVISSPRPGMARWRERLFGVMLRNARPATMYFGLPPNRVVELGTQVEI